MNVRSQITFFNLPQVASESENTTSQRRNFNHQDDKLLHLERYYLCDLTQQSVRKTFAICFESLTLDADEISMHNSHSSQMLLTNNLQSLISNGHEVNKYVGWGGVFKHLNKQQQDQYDLLSKRDYCMMVVIEGEGNKLCINNGAVENLFEIPNTYAWDKSAWNRLLQKCNQSLMNKAIHGALSIQTLIEHLTEVFGSLEPLEEVKCTCEKKRYVFGTF